MDPHSRARGSRANDVFLGDLAIALHVLAPTDQSRVADIVRLLGFTLDLEAAGGAQQTERDEMIPDFSESAPESPWRKEFVAPSAELDARREEGPGGPPIPLRALPDRSDVRDYRKRLQGWRSLPRERPRASIEAPPSLDLDLFRQRLARSLISLSLAVRTDDGEPAVEALVDALSFQRPIPRRLPRRPAPTLRFGVQVVLDRREAMRPFFSDLNSLIATVRAVVGHERTEVVAFDLRPDLLLRGPMQRTPYHPPPRGTPVLLVSDLSIGCPPWSGVLPDPGMWRRFAEELRASGCPLLVLVPYPPRRWPGGLHTHMKLLHWDRGVGVGAVRRLVGIGHDYDR
ncbi:hypothetical protein [Methylobacterium sp. Leaf100]|uniref:hypothetical protein n=1 Tax=Methylobacterium sp. Leaf100 TaxID=1736252 RepID=UPI0006FF8A8A|nr:hypothetical protein [Methylobacterium sp. Leaf100]KQP26501.1 hypothetical protein ASF25_21105 [Methylobacterium sp. Leaf100]